MENISKLYLDAYTVSWIVRNVDYVDLGLAVRLTDVSFYIYDSEILIGNCCPRKPDLDWWKVL
jgi:hypothetical protein